MDPLATDGELQTHLQRVIDPVGAELALTLASGAVRAYCGWNLAQETATLTGYGDGGQILTLPTLMLTTVTEVRIDGEVQDLTLPVTDRGRVLPTQKGQLFLAAGWPAFCEVQADVVHGYDPVPDLVKLVVLDMAARRLVNPDLLVSATVGQVSKTYATGRSDPTAMTSLHERLLDRFRL
jgi:hypothetical protein